MHAALLPSFWYWPLSQSGHAPVPAVPVAHAVQLVCSVFTAQPAPLLHDVSVCAVLSCHVVAGQSAHARFAVAEHAAVCLSPLPHDARQALHDVSVWDVESCHVSASQSPHTRLADAEHADVCFFPAPHAPQVLHAAFFASSCHCPVGQASHPVAGSPFGRLAHAVPQKFPAGQCGWCG